MLLYDMMAALFAGGGIAYALCMVIEWHELRRIEREEAR